MDEIFEKANELGLLIKGTAVNSDFERISREVENDKEASLLMKKYNEIAETIQYKKETGYTIEKYEQERFRDISEAVKSNTILLDYLKVRDRYIELLMSIHNALGSSEK